ncbi:uncharacterized protein LOC120673646 isoform X2 [Panicum virgatum]|uniref:uncharacterized protein LOC120673646 isoform X2 n=1 Tax=Panicum virgatum TaxID=38727 RepID=UPI0019D64FAF|nr:uncharacterized protein LOC120673646 isoform X2 [Panicum virgatum]
MSVIEERLVALWQSEEIFTGAVKEVKEETGIDTEFMELIAFRGMLQGKHKRIMEKEKDYRTRTKWLISILSEWIKTSSSELENVIKTMTTVRFFSILWYHPDR